jgi:molybdopterin-guanine dinucleotide biosynthesis adapter protein
LRVFGIAGRSGMGKTTLLERLLPTLVGRGLQVSLIKHSHKAIDIDRPGKDSYRLREAGCREVLLLGDGRWALMHELRGAPEPPLATLLGHMHAVDLVLVEGFKAGDFPKLEVWRAEAGVAPLHPHWPGIRAIACDRASVAALQGHAPAVPVLALEDAAAIADFVQRAAVIPHGPA